MFVQEKGGEEEGSIRRREERRGVTDSRLDPYPRYNRS